MRGLRQAICSELDSGAAVSQIKEALSQLYAYTGFSHSLNSLNTAYAQYLIGNSYLAPLTGGSLSDT